MPLILPYGVPWITSTREVSDVVRDRCTAAATAAAGATSARRGRPRPGPAGRRPDRQPGRRVRPPGAPAPPPPAGGSHASAVVAGLGGPPPGVTTYRLRAPETTETTD